MSMKVYDIEDDDYEDGRSMVDFYNIRNTTSKFYIKTIYNFIDYIITQNKANVETMAYFGTLFHENICYDIFEFVTEKETEWMAKNNKTHRGQISWSYHEIITADDLIYIREKIKEKNPFVEEPFEITQTIRVISELLGISDYEQCILQAAYHNMTDLQFSSSLSFLVRNVDLNVILGYSKAPKKLAVVDYGIIHINSLKIPTIENLVFEELLENENLDLDDITKKLFPNQLETELTIDNFYQKSDIETIRKIIDTANDTKEKGINILFYGFPGTGKTELAKVLAKEFGWELVVVGDIDENAEYEMSRQERLVSLRIAQKIFKNRDNVVLLFDEMEDLFKIDLNATMSKGFVNRTLSETPVPIIWTTNSLGVMDQSQLRRMTYSVKFEVPPANERKLIWDKYINRYDVKLSDSDLSEISLKYDISPAMIENITRISGLGRFDKPEIESLIKNNDTTLNYGVSRDFNYHQVPKEYDSRLINSNYDLGRIVERIKQNNVKNFSMLLYGPSGTGKSEFAKFMATELGMTIMFKRSSDLVSPYVGETEANIAKAFEDASENNQFLIIDEADSFFHTRENAQRSWEVSHVNEMLTQMEKHDKPFVCTTNLKDVLDPASFRRFTFKIKFDFLKSDQACELFKNYFGIEPPKGLAQQEYLTPGDFALVKKKVDILGIDDVNEIYQLLLNESEHKPEQKTKIGF